MAVGALFLNLLVKFITSFPFHLHILYLLLHYCSLHFFFFFFLGLQRCGKSCRLRWINYLRPDLKRGPFSQQEEDLIVELHAVLGNRYSHSQFTIKSYLWVTSPNTHLATLNIGFLLHTIMMALTKEGLFVCTLQMVSNCCSATGKNRQWNQKLVEFVH